MDKMKRFFMYFLIVVAFFIFSNIMINGLFKASYSNMHGYEINVNSEQLFVDVTEAKASNRDGYIKGIVKNNSEEPIENKYLKVTMLSKKGNAMGEKYIKIDKLEPNKLKKFEVRYSYGNVNTFKIELMDEKPEDEDLDFIKILDENGIHINSKSFKDFWKIKVE